MLQVYIVKPEQNNVLYEAQKKMLKGIKTHWYMLGFETMKLRFSVNSLTTRLSLINHKVAY